MDIQLEKTKNYWTDVLQTNDESIIASIKSFSKRKKRFFGRSWRRKQESKKELKILKKQYNILGWFHSQLSLIEKDGYFETNNIWIRIYLIF
jgi:hypothetical protein